MLLKTMMMIDDNNEKDDDIHDRPAYVEGHEKYHHIEAVDD